jgi:peptidoglycan/LPS O-acetylase OafA/YrhL
LPGFWGKGAVGVDLFFALSGFLITTLLLRERASAGGIALGRFYARRTLRIFPLYYAVLLAHVVYALLLPSASPVRDHFFSSLPYYVSYTANWFVDFGVPHPVLFAFSWSLAVEEQFYLVWPALLGFVRGPRLLAGFMLAMIVSDALLENGTLTPLLSAHPTALRIVTSFAPPIGFGALLALLYDTPWGFRLSRRILGARLVAPYLLLAALCLLALPTTPYLALSLCLAALVGSVVVRPDHDLAWFLDRPLVRRLGDLSYAAYLVHVGVLGGVRAVLPGFKDEALVVFACGLPLSFLLALLLHRAFETPLARYRARLREPASP